MNEDYTLTAFAEPITALADDPQLPPDEMKRRLQAPADELLEAHNALARTVKGITDATYPDTVTEDMLTDELAAKINNKAAAADVTALDTRVDALEDALPEKCEMFYGSYTGTGQNGQMITLGFQPKSVLVIDPVTDTSTTDRLNFCGLGILGNPASSHIVIQQTGFSISIMYGGNLCLNKSGHTYFYLAFC